MLTKWHWTIKIHRGYLTLRIPILQVAAGVVGLGIVIMCTGIHELTW